MTTNYVQLRAALDGSFEHEVEAGRRSVVVPIGLAMEELADELVGKLQYDFQQSGMENADRLKKAAWRRSEIYGKGRSLSPAAWIFSKLPVVVQAFENGVTIRAKDGKGLLIPNPDVWPGGRARFGRGRKMGDIWALAAARFGDLQVVRRPGKNPIVVAKVRMSEVTGRFRKASASALKREGAGKASGLASIIVFTIARDAKLPKLLKGDVIRSRAQRDAPGRMQSLFHKYFTAYDGAGPRQLSFSGTRRYGSQALPGDW